PKAAKVPVTTLQQSAAERRALLPIGYETSFVAGSNPQIHRPCRRMVLRGPSVRLRPPRSTVTVIGRPWLDRIRREMSSKLVAGRPFTATTRSPGRRPAAAAGVCAVTAATSLLGCEVGAPVA